MENRYCPLMKMEIDDGTCFDIHMVIEGLAPNRTVPEKILEFKDRENICLECKYHQE